MVIKIRGTASLGGEVKPSAVCFKILGHVKYPLTYDTDTDRKNSAAISHPVSPPLHYWVSLLQQEQRTVVD
jgi:hypothetical protein